jgi:hypothetical protein
MSMGEFNVSKLSQNLQILNFTEIIKISIQFKKKSKIQQNEK